MSVLRARYEAMEDEGAWWWQVLRNVTRAKVGVARRRKLWAQRTNNLTPKSDKCLGQGDATKSASEASMVTCRCSAPNGHFCPLPHGRNMLVEKARV